MIWKKINNCLTVGAEDKSEISIVTTSNVNDNDVMQTIVGINDTMDDSHLYNVHHISGERGALIYTMRAIPRDAPLTRYRVKMNLEYDSGCGFDKWPFILGARDVSTFASHNNIVTTAILLMWTAIDKLNLTHYMVNIRGIIITKDAHGKETAQITCNFGRFKRNTLTIIVEDINDPS